MITDLKFSPGSDGIYNLGLNDDGDFETGNFFDTSLLYAIYGERRASESEVEISHYRRGWIGNENKDFENGSKIWLFEQARLTRTNLNNMKSAALDALQYLVDDDIVYSIDASVLVKNGATALSLNIFVDPSTVETRYFELWKNTGL